MPIPEEYANLAQGADLVDAALAELRNTPKTSYERQNRPSGMVSTVLYYVMKTIPTGPAKAPTHDNEAPPPSGDKVIGDSLSNAVDLLGRAAKQNNSDAIYLLADMNYFGSYGYPRDLRAAFDHYHSLASLHGNATAQYMLAVYYSTGLADIVPRDQARALLYHSFAAAGGNLRSEMAIGFRFHSAVGAVKSCEKAIAHYKRVADKAVEWYRSGPPGGNTWVHQAWRISDDVGGVYGQGASASSAGLNAGRSAGNLDANAAIGDVIEYLDLISQKGDYKAALNLGRIYYEGQRGLEQDLDMARKYFFLVASRYWKRDGRVVENHKPGIEKIAGKAAAYIGRMYLRGEGVPQNFGKAKLWFERGLPTGDPLAQYGLGLISLRGYTGKKNVKRAMDLFKASAEQDFAPAQVEMGKLYLDQGGTEDLRHANNYFELAARYGNIEAYYYLAEMVHNAVGREKLCGIALNYYKLVAEKVEPLISSWADANEAYEAGDYETAFLGYLLAAEQGYERAQTNVAYMLDSGHSQTPLVSWAANQMSKSAGSEKKPNSVLNNDGLALIQWTRSSKQSNIDSTVKMGDYYYYGVGTDRDIPKAVQCYTAASDHSQSAQALFNLGWMYENGVGLVQDFHLAKRYYDHALTLNKEAYLPVTLSLIKLRVRSAWNTLTHGEIHSIQDEPSKSDITPIMSTHILTFFLQKKIGHCLNGSPTS